MWCGCTSVIILSCAQPHPRRVTQKRRSIAKRSLQLGKQAGCGAIGERGACAQRVSVVEAEIADQRSSKLAAGTVFASTMWPIGVVVPVASTMPSVPGACDLMVAAVAATASRATVTNPVIVRCLVIGTSCGPKAPQSWVTGTTRRFNSNATRINCAIHRSDNDRVPNSNRCSRLLERYSPRLR